jgi:polyphosphate kinase 2 (PPK2 family)
MEDDGMPKKIFTQELEGTGRRGRPRKSWKEEVEREHQVEGVRRWRELVANKKKMEGHCSTGQSPQWAVVPMEGEVLQLATRFRSLVKILCQ